MCLPAAAAAVVVCAFALAAFALAAFTPRDLKPVLRVACDRGGRARAGAGHRFARASAVHRGAADSRGGLRVCAGMRSRARSWRAGRARRRRGHLDSDLRLFRRTDWREGYPALSRGALLAPGIASVCPVCGERGRQNGASRAAIAVFAIIQAVHCVSARCGEPGGFRSAGADRRFSARFACCFQPRVTPGLHGLRARTESAQRTVFAAWGAALLLAGSFLCLPPVIVIPLLGAAALAAMGLSRRERWTGL